MEGKIFGSVDHVSIAVNDVDKARAHFSQLLDTEFVRLGTLEELGLVSWMSPCGLELLGATRPDGDIAKFLEKKGEGVYALAFITSDIDKARAKVKQMGIRIAGEIAVDEGPAKGTRELWLHPKDNFGVYLMLTQGNPFRPQDIQDS
jgi:methylmalonyl-CoA/ethylmalonyl-CoA epimerase